MSLHLPEIRLRPVTEADLGMFRRFVVEPGLIGLDWSGFRDPNAVQRRFDTDSYLGEDSGRLIVDVAAVTEPGREPAAKQCSLEKTGFTLEGTIRAAEFRAGQWRNGYLYSRLRTDPDPLAD